MPEAKDIDKGKKVPLNLAYDERHERTVDFTQTKTVEIFFNCPSRREMANHICVTTISECAITIDEDHLLRGISFVHS